MTAVNNEPRCKFCNSDNVMVIEYANATTLWCKPCIVEYRLKVELERYATDEKVIE